MSDTSNFAANYTSMKKCSKIFNVIPLVYVGICISYLAYSSAWMMGLSYDSLFVFFDGLIISPLICYLGFRGAYKKHDLAVMAAPVILLLNLFILLLASKNMTGKVYGYTSLNVAMFEFYACLVMFITSSVLAFINMKTNIQYRYLEKQVGFPFFNERVEEQRVNKIRREIKDPFQVEYEKRMRTASTEMTDLEIAESTGVSEDIDKNSETADYGMLALELPENTGISEDNDNP